MKTPLKLSVTQIRVFAADVIGIQHFRNPSTTEKIRERYGFSTSSSPFGGLPIGLEMGTSLQFNSGQFVYQDRKGLVESLAIEERRILFTIEGYSEIAHGFFKDLRQMLEELDIRQDKPSYEPLVVAEETVCIAQFSFPFLALLSEGLIELQKEMKKVVQLSDTKVDLFPISVKFAVRYLSIPPELARKKVSLSDKEISIEVRAKTDPGEQIYFTKSPFSSDIHLRLLEDMEKKFNQSE